MFYHSILILFIIHKAYQFNWKDINLHKDHLKFYFKNNLNLKNKCINDKQCPFKNILNENECWGYEENCNIKSSYLLQKPVCNGDHKGWVKSKEEQLDFFYKQGDFGFVQMQRNSLKYLCRTKGSHEESSSLECSDHLNFCRGKNILINFEELKHRTEPVRYHMDVLKPGNIQGYCKLNETLLERNLDQISPLQSWGPELRNFKEAPEPLVLSKTCDFWIDTPTIITKIDAPVNMYHHFCDFFNLYAAQHVNNSDEFAFSQNVQILIWESFLYHSNFGVSWKAFTSKPIWTLDKVAGKKICFKDVMFPLLPRMIFGLYYNTPLIWGCEKSGLFHAFSHHFLHRLGIAEREKLDDRIHITFLSRQSQYRRIINEDQMIEALNRENKFIVKKAVYGHNQDFTEQLKNDQWTDLFVGIHGAGLTHLLFLPDWAVVFELYNCGDANCYKDLARLRGIHYITWEDNSKLRPTDEGHHPNLGAHEKFTNYYFDIKEFIRLVHKAEKIIKENPKWKKGIFHSETHEEL